MKLCQWFGIILLGFSIFACKSKSTFKGGTQTADAEKKPAVIEPKPVETVKPNPVVPGVFDDCDKSTNSPFSADLYQIPENTEKLPENYSVLTSLKKVCLKQLDIKERDFDNGFPGVPDLKEWFSLDFKFTVNVQEPGLYEFSLSSDDGSKLIIDGALVINNDGQHATEAKSGTVSLSKGPHKFNLPYFQGPANRIALELFWKKPGASALEYIPAELVSPGE